MTRRRRIRTPLANPRRRVQRCLITRQAADHVGERELSRVKVEIVAAEQVSRVLPKGAVHQGIALACEPLAVFARARPAALACDPASAESACDRPV